MVRVETLYELFPEQSREAIDSLVEDPDFQKQLPSLILNRIEKSAGNILPIDSTIVPLLFSKADFADVEEAYTLANHFSKYFSHRGRFLPLATNHLEDLELSKLKNQLTEKVYSRKGEDFASRCLFSLSLFYDALEHLHSRHGAPHPRFYREIGKRTFERVGQEGIASHFESWEDFIREDAFNQKN